MAGLSVASVTPKAISIGTTPIKEISLGTTVLWNQAMIRDDFDILGFLADWINDFLEDAQAGIGGLLNSIISDGFGGLVNGIGTSLGDIVKFVPTLGGLGSIAQGEGLGSIGTLITGIPGGIEQAICAGLDAVGGITDGTLVDGVIGFINGLPIIGGFAGFVQDIIGGEDPLEAIETMIGAVPIFQDFAELIGVLGDQATGIFNDPINFVTNLVGEVVGTLSCGLLGGQTVHFPIGSIGNLARMLVPDGLVSMAKQESIMRHETVIADDGYLEIQIATQGDPGFTTTIYRRYDDSGARASGVGIQLVDSIVSLVRRIGGTEDRVKPQACAFSPGDIIRLVETGNVHVLTLNGHDVTTWTDSGNTAEVGPGNRSVAMRMESSQDLLGPRRFSPSLNYLEAA